MLKLSFLVFALFLCPSFYATFYYQKSTSSSESSSEIIGYSSDFERLFPDFKDVSTYYESSPNSKGLTPEKPSFDSFKSSGKMLNYINEPTQVADGYTRAEPHSDGFTHSESHSDGFKFAQPSSAGHSGSSSHPAGSFQPLLLRDDVLPFPLDMSDFWTSQLKTTPASAPSSHLPSSTPGRFRQAENVVYSSSSRGPGFHGAFYEPSSVSDEYSHVEDDSDKFSSSYTLHDSNDTHEPSPVTDGYMLEVKSDGYSSKVPVLDTSSSHESRPVADGYSVVESIKGTASRSSSVPGKKNTQSQLDAGYTLVKPKYDGHLSSSKVPDTSRSHHELTDGYRHVEAKSDGNRKVLDLDNSSLLESRLVADGYTLVESNPVELSSTSTVNHFKDFQSQHVEIDTDSAVTSKTTTVKPVSAGFFSKFNNGGNFAVQRPRKTQEHESTSTHSVLNTDANRRILTTHTGDESDSVEAIQDLSTIRNKDGEDQDGVLAYLVSDEGNPGSDFILTKSALIQSGLVFNKVVSMSANTVDAGGKVEILDNRSFHLTGLRYAGPGPARWIAGTTFPVGLYSDTVVLASWTPGLEKEFLKLPGQVTVADISWLALYCRTCAQGRVIMQVYVPETFL